MREARLQIHLQDVMASSGFSQLSDSLRDASAGSGASVSLVAISRAQDCPEQAGVLQEMSQLKRRLSFRT